MRNLNKHLPFLLPLASLILGIYWQNLFASNTIALPLAIIFILASLFYLTIKKVDANPNSLIYFLFFFSGAFLFQHQKDVNFELLAKFQNRPLSIIAKVTSIENQQSNFVKQAITLAVTKINYGEESLYQKTRFNLLCYAQVPFNIQIDDEIELTNIILKNSNKKTGLENRPTFYDYLLKENVLSTTFLNNKTNLKLIYKPTFSIKRWIINKRNAIYDKLKQKLSPLTFSYFSSIFLGKKSDLDFSEMKNKFNNWGVVHYLARSGLHIIIFILIWKFLLSFFPLPLLLKIFFLILLCLCYHLLSWPSISLYRALYLFLLYETGRLLHQQTTFLHILSLIGLAILLINPMQLFFLDFQLSFALTFSLAWLNFSTKK